MTQAKVAVILARVSSKEQEEGYSIDAQVHRLQEYCRRKNLTVLETFKVIESSTICHRRQFMEMIKFAKKHKQPVAIVADKVDRVQRSFQEYPILDPMIKEGKIELHFNTEGYIIHKDSISQERLMWSIGVVMAQSYVDSMRDNINRSIAQKLRSGEWISTAPVGYMHVKRENGKSDIVVDTDRAPLLRQMFEQYATGNYSLSQLMKYCKKIGLRNCRGNQKGLTANHIHKMLQDPFYYGVMRVKKTGAEYPHRYEPIISKSLFDMCQEVREGRSKKMPLYRGKDFVFRGILTCAITGRLATAETHSKTYQNGGTGSWTYLAIYNPEKPEKKMWVREEDVIAQAEDALATLKITDTESLIALLNYIRSTNAEKKIFHRGQTASLKKEHTEIEEKLDKLLDLLMDKVLDKAEFEAKKKKLKDRQYEINELIYSFDEADDKFSKCLIDLINIATGALDDFKGSDVTRKRELLNFVFQNLSLRGKKLEYTMRYPFSEFAKCSKLEEWWGERDLNPRPRRYERPALTAELSPQV